MERAPGDMSETTPALVSNQPESREGLAWKVAKVAASTVGFLPKGLEGKTAEVFMILLAGQTLGLDYPESLRSVHYIAGKVVYSAELQRALILRAGHRLDVEDYSDTSVTLRGTRTDGSTMAVTWDLERAKTAGLTTKPGDSWKRYTRAMLLARCTSELGRALFADCLAGLASYNAYDMDSDWQADISTEPLLESVEDADVVLEESTEPEPDTVDNAEAVDNEPESPY